VINEAHSYHRTAGAQKQAQVPTALDVHFPGVPTIEPATRTLCRRARRAGRRGKAAGLDEAMTAITWTG